MRRGVGDTPAVTWTWSRSGMVSTSREQWSRSGINQWVVGLSLLVDGRKEMVSKLAENLQFIPDSAQFIFVRNFSSL